MPSPSRPLRIIPLTAVAMPFRLRPILLEVRRVLRGDSSYPRLAQRLKSRIKDCLRSALKGLPRSGTPGLKIAQVAGAWENCEWFVGMCGDLQERGYEVIAIIDSRRGDLGERLAAVGIPVHTMPLTFATSLDRGRLALYALRIPIAALRLARILRRERIDIVHSHIFASVVIARMAAALARVRHVAGIPGPRHLEARLTSRVDRLTWWLDDATIAGCRYTYDFYSTHGANEQRLHCVYYGADATRFDPALADPSAARQALGIADGAPLIVLVAHFYPPTRGAQTPIHTMGRGLKGHEDFLEAARTIARALPNARFVLAGSGVLDSGPAYRQRLMKECLEDELLRDRALFVGNYHDVPSLLAAANVAVQCSLTENLGGTIEALLMERPVVATRVGGMPESVRDGETGLLVPPSDPQSLAAAILRLLADPEEAAAFGRAGRRLMLERFTSARTVDDLDAVYRGLTTGAPVPPLIARANGAHP